MRAVLGRIGSALKSDKPARRSGEDPVWRAMVLVIVTGFVDAVGFLALAGTFVAS